MRKHLTKTKYSYNIGAVTRKCNHTEDVGTITTDHCWEPTVKKWEENKLCKDCALQARIDRDKKINHMNELTEKYCREHGIDKNDCAIEVYDNSAEIRIFINNRE